MPLIQHILKFQMTFMIKTYRRGFTLIELLVVISIVAVLSTLAAVMAPKILKKAAQTKTMASMKNMGSSLRMYANDNANRLPAPLTPAAESAAKEDTYWFTYLEQQITSKDLESLLKDSYWKNIKNSDQLNNMMPKKEIKHNSVGFAMNGSLANNVALSRGETLPEDELLTTPVNLNTLDDQQRIPIVRPHWTWSYTGDKKEAIDKRLAPFLAGGNLPVLFLDGHVESMTPLSYANQGMNKRPQADKSKSTSVD